MDISDNMDIVLRSYCNEVQFNDTAEKISSNLTSLNSTAYSNITFDLDRLRAMCSDPNMGFISENKLLQQLTYYLSGIAGFIVCILGCMGNGLSIAILQEKMYTSSTNVYLLALAVADILLLVFAMVLSLNDIFKVALPDCEQTAIFHSYTHPYVNAFVNTFQTISIWLVLGFTVDRYIMICHPFQGAKFCNRKRATVVVVCLYIFGLLYNIPKFFESRTYIQYIDGQKYVGVELTHLGGNDFYIKFVHLWAYLVFIFVLPCLTLAVLNFQLIVTVKQSKTKGRRLSWGTTCNHRNDTTLMLVAVVVVFLVCQMPALISNTIYASMTDNFISGPARFDYLQIIAEIANFLVILNSAINILLYYVFSAKFRAAFIHKFLNPCLQKSKVLVTIFSRRISCHSTDTETGTVLTNDLVIDMEMDEVSGHKRCITVLPDNVSLGSPSKMEATFSTLRSCTETRLITPTAAHKLLHFNSDIDPDIVSQSSSSSDNTRASNPTHV